MRRNRTWTAKDAQLLRRHYGPSAPEPLTAREIAVLLGIGPAGKNRVIAFAYRLGLTRRRNARWVECADRVRRLHAEGKSAASIAREVGCNDKTVCAWLRKHLGVEPHDKRCPSYRRGQSRNLRRTCRAAGVADFNGLRRLHRDVGAALAGYPGAPLCYVPALRVLERGPLTAPELGSACGRSVNWGWRATRVLRRLGIVRPSGSRGRHTTWELSR